MIIGLMLKSNLMQFLKYDIIYMYQCFLIFCQSHVVITLLVTEVTLLAGLVRVRLLLLAGIHIYHKGVKTIQLQFLSLVT